MEPDQDINVEATPEIKNESSSADKPKKNIGIAIVVIALALVAVGGIGFGIWAVLDGNQKAKDLNVQIDTLKAQLAEKDNSENVVVESTENGETGVVVNAKEYIFVSEWGIKIKIPRELKDVSYTYHNDGNGIGMLAVAGVSSSSSSDDIPEFANLFENNTGLGAISRTPKGAEVSIASPPSLVFSDNNYDYYYSHPQAAFSNDEAEIQLEVESTGIVEDMLKDEENYSKI